MYTRGRGAEASHKTSHLSMTRAPSTVPLLKMSAMKMSFHFVNAALRIPAVTLTDHSVNNGTSQKHQ